MAYKKRVLVHKKTGSIIIASFFYAPNVAYSVGFVVRQGKVGDVAYPESFIEHMKSAAWADGPVDYVCSASRRRLFACLRSKILEKADPQVKEVNSRLRSSRARI